MMLIRKSLILLLWLSLAACAIAQTEAPIPARAEIPGQVALPVGKPFPVTLDTALSTRESKQNQTVTFHLTYSLLLGDSLEVPPDTKILGHVVEVKRSGHFNKQATILLAVDRIKLNTPGDADVGTSLTAHLNSVATKRQVLPVGENSAPTDSRISATNSAGDGPRIVVAPIDLIITSRPGEDLYVVAGTRFTVTIDQPANLVGAAVRAAQQNFKQDPGPYGIQADPNKDGDPALKRRTVPQQ